MNTIWSENVQGIKTLYLTRQLRFDDLFYSQYEKLFGLDKNASLKILEIGCGPGALSQALHRWYPNAQITAIDRDSNFISFAKDSDIKIPKGQSYITYIQCENKAKLLGNSSGFYNYTTSKEGNASYIMEKNKDLFIRNNLDENKKNIFYQIFECEPNTISNNEIYVSIDGNGLNRLYENDNYIKGQNSIYFYLKTNDEFLFNYYKTSSDKNKYDSIKKYDNPNFNITILSKNHTKIDNILNIFFSNLNF